MNSPAQNGPSNATGAPQRIETHSRRADVFGWLLVAALLLAQWGMFRQFALREVVWSYPPNHDQLGYLEQSYTAYERILVDPRRGLEEAARFRKTPPPRAAPGSVVLPRDNWRPDRDWQRTRASGIMLPVHAALLFCLAGPIRLVALSLNFFYFALLQCVLVWTIKWLSGRWSVALVALGLLLLAKTPFYAADRGAAGSLFDFRLDFISFCLYGVFLCLVIRSEIFADRKWSLIAGACGALLFTFRFIMLVYLGGVLALLVAFLAGGLWMNRENAARRPELSARMQNALLASALIAAVAVPILADRARAVWGYYGVGHLTGAEKQIRAEEQGVTGARAALLFYPESLYRDHGGHVLFGVIKWVLIGCAAVFAIGFLSGRRQSAPHFNLALSCGFVALAGLVPLVALTADKAKSPVVADIMVVPVLLLVVLVAITLVGAHRGVRLPTIVCVALGLMAGLVLGRAVVAQADEYGHRTWMTWQRDDVDRILSIHDRLASAATAMGLPRPRFAFDSTSDALNDNVFQVLAYERHSQVFEADEVLGNFIFARDPRDTLQRLSHADFAVLTDGPAPPGGTFELPFDRAMQQLKPRLFDWCRRNCVELASERLGAPFNCTATIFARPEVRVQGEPDGWIASRGTTVTGLADVLRRLPLIELHGRGAEHLPQSTHVTAMVDLAGERVNVPAQLRIEPGGEYTLGLRIDPAHLPAHGAVQIELSFDSFFVPRKINGTADDRELVMRLADEAELRPADPAAEGPG